LHYVVYAIIHHTIVDMEDFQVPLDNQLTLLSQFEDTQSSLSSVTIPSSLPSELQRPQDFTSNRAESNDPIPVTSINQYDYSWVNWRHPNLTSCHKLLDTTELQAWWWNYGVPVISGDINRRYFLCQLCGRADVPFIKKLVVDSGSHSVIHHLEYSHQVRKTATTPLKRRRIQQLELPAANAAQESHQDMANSLAESFSFKQFRKLLI